MLHLSVSELLVLTLNNKSAPEQVHRIRSNICWRHTAIFPTYRRAVNSNYSFRKSQDFPFLVALYLPDWENLRDILKMRWKKDNWLSRTINHTFPLSTNIVTFFSVTFNVFITSEVHGDKLFQDLLLCGPAYFFYQLKCTHLAYESFLLHTFTYKPIVRT